jgi:hypothetical protein
MLVTGTRASNRTQFETLAPVDVFTKEDITSVESTDLKDVLAQLVPSFVVQRLPMADGQVFVRPAAAWPVAGPDPGAGQRSPLPPQRAARQPWCTGR